MELRIAAMRWLATEIIGVELVALDGSVLPPFDAGAHIDVHLPGALIRQYSLCNHPDERHRYCIGVLKDAASRGGSRAVHDQLRVGQTVQVSAPRNLFALQGGAGRSVLLAGGIGITPMLSMAQRLAQQGRNFELHYCVRSKGRAAFIDTLHNSAFAAQVHLHVDDGAAQQKLDMAGVLAAQDDQAHLYVCGPTGFMEHVLNSARAHQWPEARLHREYFAAAPRAEGDAGSFEVRLRSTGLQVLVPADKTVVQALEEAGVFIPVSCEQGFCGTCLTAVLGGQPDHRDSFLTDAEKARNNQFTPCCSRAKSAVLELDL
jgi:vanillate O-demethylase ferredoxin subunit